jgi:hypothetical protein
MAQTFASAVRLGFDMIELFIVPGDSYSASLFGRLRIVAILQ